jgi:hypothetical protein
MAPTPDIAIGAAAAAIGATMGVSFAEFAASAAAGTFAISPTGGQALLTAIRNMKDWVDHNRGDLRTLAQEPKLGESHGAQTMTKFMPQVANDHQGLIPMLMKFRESLEDAEKGINDAMKNYQEMDQRGVSRQQSA